MPEDDTNQYSMPLYGLGCGHASWAIANSTGAIIAIVSERPRRLADGYSAHKMAEQAASPEAGESELLPEAGESDWSEGPLGEIF